MRATVMHGAGDVRVETVPDAGVVEPSDVGRRMGHEFIGVVDAVGADVRKLKVGDLVVTPFVWSDGTCVLCREGVHTSCLHGGRYGSDGVDGGQGEAVRVPQA